MSRRRANKRKGNAEAIAVDDSDEEQRKEDKRSRLEPAAAAAAASSSSSAAAGSSASAAPSAASAAASSSRLHDEVEDVVCSACHEAFDCADDSARLPRTLPCGHPMCSACIRQSLGLTPGSVLCPHEHGQLKISVPAGVAAAAVSTVEGWLRLLPPRADLITAIRNQQRLMARLGQQGARCAHEGCAAVVTDFCADCGDLCSTHEQKRHALEPFEAHKLTTVPIAQKAATLESKITGQADKYREQADARLTQQFDLTQIAKDELKRLEAQTQLQLQQKRQEVEEKERALGALLKAHSAMLMAKNCAVLELEADRREAEWQRQATAHARPLADSAILTEHDDHRVAELQTLLGKTGSLSKAKLLYRASRDGFTANDWWPQCGGKYRLLTLIRVKGNGFVFGAFTPFQWPKERPEHITIADPSSTTFVFSLVNAHNRAIKLKLKQGDYSKGAAGQAFWGSGPIFGRDLGLMCNGFSADQPGGNFTGPCTFQFDSVSDGGKPIKYDKTLLAGDDGTDGVNVYFAAAEIECWKL